MISSATRAHGPGRLLGSPFVVAIAVATLSAGALAETPLPQRPLSTPAAKAAPMPPVIINNSDTSVDVPDVGNPPIPMPKVVVEPPPRPLQSAPAKAAQPQAPSTLPPSAQAQPAPLPPITIAEIVAANVATPENICPAVTTIIMAEPGAAFDLIETARQRPKQSEGLAQCLSQIQSKMKANNPDGAKAIDALVASAPASFQAAYAVALATSSGGDGGSSTADAGGGGDGGGSSGGGSSSGGSSSGGGTSSGGGGTGFSGFAGGGAIGGSGSSSGGNFGIPVSRSTP